ncbi:hypothetical protein E0D86_19510 [Pseudomonas sp. IC_126]|uniref:hypothetical protein n=1 Tax=Pseudomonas sp. IC_126 TaxID=2547400 RepID=UPI00103AC30C|nr:hypothetical protein [Pseudomonas sp. IC_126]TCD18637.1 hypothetical protein E0D86_19510 [Pseudomonas sp. IC_126]
MRKTIVVTAIAITLASGLSFAAADKESKSHSENGMMSGGMHMEMMGDMHGMMKECREMMGAAKASHSQNGQNPDEA